MMKTAIVAFGALLAFASSPVCAASSAGDLLAACNSASGSSGDGLCNAYMNGFVQGIFVDQIAREEHEPICVDNTNTGALRKALIEYLKDHANAAYLPAGSVLGVAVQRLYACK